MVTAGAGGDSFDSFVLIGWLYPVSVTSHTAKSRKNSVSLSVSCRRLEEEEAAFWLPC